MRNRITNVGLVFGIVSASAIAVGGGTISAQSISTCSNVLFIGVRESGADQTADAGMGFVVKSVRNELQKYTKKSLTFASVGLEYPAYSLNAVSDFKNFVKLFVSDTGAPNPSTYVEGIWNGSEFLTGKVEGYIQRCPASMVILSGYSQGAAVIRLALNGLSVGARARVVGVALFGDPTRSVGDGLQSFGSPAQPGGIYTAVLNDIGRVPSLGGGNSTFFGSWCLKGDPICDWAKFNAVKDLARKAPLLSPIHGRYCCDGSTTDAAIKLSQAINLLPASIVSRSGKPTVVPPPTPAPTTPQPAQSQAAPAGQSPGAATREQTGRNGASTFLKTNASGPGAKIPPRTWVEVSCKVKDLSIASVRPDGYWYRIASSPWNNQYYAPANTFMNGDPPEGPFTHNTDFSVLDCIPEAAPVASETVSATTPPAFPGVTSQTNQSVGFVVGSGAANTTAWRASWSADIGNAANEVHSWAMGCIQDFRGGAAGDAAMMQPSCIGEVFRVPTPFWLKVVQYRAETIGYPSRQPYTWGNATAQDFVGGAWGPNIVIQSIGSSVAYVVRSGMYVEFQRRGGMAGQLGYPIGDEYSTPEGPRQDFAGGTVTYQGASAVVTLR